MADDWAKMAAEDPLDAIPKDYLPPRDQLRPHDENGG